MMFNFKKITEFFHSALDRIRDFIHDPLPVLKRLWRAYRPTRFDRYVLKRYIIATLGALFFFAVIYQLTQIFNDMRWVPQGSSVWLIIRYYVMNGVYWVLILEPFAFMFGTVYVMSQMAQHKEMIAIVSTGTSVYRASFYMLFVTILYYLLLVFFLQDHFFFQASQQKNILNRMLFQKVNPKELERLKDNGNSILYGENGLIYVVGRYVSVAKELQQITVLKMVSPGQKGLNVAEVFSNSGWIGTNADELNRIRDLQYNDQIKISLRIDAEKAIWNSEQKKWMFMNGVYRVIINNGESFTIEPFTQRTFDDIKDPPYYFEKAWYDMESMTYAEGRRHIEKLKRTRQDYRGPLAQYYIKFSYSLGILFFVLIGIGIVDLSKRKSSFIVNFILSMVWFAVYYVFFATGQSLAAKGTVSPIVGAFLGAAVFIFVSVYYYRRVKT